MSRWFRHYAGMVRDAKLVRVALHSNQTIERVVWVYGAILESAAEINDGGRYDFDAAEAAHFLHADMGDISAIEASLAACGRISEGRIAKWGDRQFISDDSAERVRRHREKQKSQRNSDDKSGQNVTERDGNKDVTLRNAPETETETYTIAQKPKPSDVISVDFLAFYAAYPKKKSRQDAEKAYRQVRKRGVSHETIMAGLEKAKRADHRFRDEQFMPYPASWLRDGGYEDESNIAPGNRPFSQLGIV